ncbi:hypothetical protein I2483_12905 [Sporosarcina sp. E16_3]|uniref:hypothetical protein n=1 Tax=Sporosarcina sp. E16_3 TaxID=2789293 RepID=UPI001A915CDC|nr:hypothetical protein [Sporosarcina sp. E16_3]MBO0602559.1 hypothetical protein [Sporosarcina sp. E16_3]
MKTQSISVIILSILCVSLLWFSASTWQEKVRNAGGHTARNAEIPQSPLVENEAPVKKASPVQYMSTTDLLKIGASLDDKTLEVVISRAEAGKHVQMLIVGSEAIAAAAERFATVISDKYGGLIGVDVATFDMTSTRFVAEALEAGKIEWEAGYDIVLYEPFTLHNNGEVVIENERKDLLAVKALAESYVEDVSFLVTPPQPIYRAGYYLTQIQALKKFTSARGIPYINHWPNWPDTRSDELLTYIDETRMPTESGIKAWSDALIAYFVDEKFVK